MSFKKFSSLISKTNSFIFLAGLSALLSCNKSDPTPSIASPSKGILAVEKITPAEVYRLDTITITGNNFGTDKTKLEVSFSGTLGTITSVTNTSLKVVVPLTLFSSQVAIFVNKGTESVLFGTSLTILKPPFDLYQMSPMNGSAGQIVRIYGTGLPANASDIKVSFNDGAISGTIVYSGSAYFDVLVPNGVQSGNFKITIGGKHAPSPVSFTIVSGGKWEELTNAYPGTAQAQGISGFTIGGLAYIGFDIANFWSNDMYSYNPSSDQWVRLADFPGASRSQPFIFVIGTKAYVGSGLSSYNNYAKDFWVYDSVLDSWTQLADFPGTARWQSISFAANSKGYVGLGEGSGMSNVKDFWEFDPSTNQWTQLSDFPGTARTSASLFMIDTKVYVVGGFSNDYLSEVWEFNTATNQWLQKRNLPNGPRRDIVAFSVSGKGVITGGYNFNDTFFRDSYVYDPATDSWTRYANYYGNETNMAYATSINGFGYVFGGQGNIYKKVYKFTLGG